jgi:hypothetical protein
MKSVKLIEYQFCQLDQSSYFTGFLWWLNDVIGLSFLSMAWQIVVAMVMVMIICTVNSSNLLQMIIRSFETIRFCTNKYEVIYCYIIVYRASFTYLYYELYSIVNCLFICFPYYIEGFFYRALCHKWSVNI